MSAKVKFQFYSSEYDNLESGAGDVILVMGGKALQPLRDGGILHKSMSVNKLREKVHLWKGTRTLVSFGVGLCDIEPGRKYDIVWDARLALRLYQTLSLVPQVGHYKWVKNYAPLLARIKNAPSKITVCLDLEAIGLDPFKLKDDNHPGAKIISVSLTTAAGRSSLVYLPDLNPDELITLKRHLKEICTSPKVKMVGANLKFDSGWLKEHLGFFIENQTFDTTLVGSLIDENRSNGLELHAKVYTEMGGYDKEMATQYDKGRMDLIPKGPLLTYAGGDTDATFRVMEKLRGQLLEDKHLSRFYVNVLQPSSTMFAKLEHRGVLVDRGRYEELKVEVSAEKKRLSDVAVGLMPAKLRYKHKDNLSLTRATLIQDFMFTPAGLNLKPQMFTEKTQAPSTAISHLEMFSDHPDAAEFITALRAFNSASKTLSTYIVGFMKHIRSDGKFHPSYSLYKGKFGESDKETGTVTGRLSATTPAYQTIPLHTIWAKGLRSV